MALQNKKIYLVIGAVVVLLAGTIPFLTQQKTEETNYKQTINPSIPKGDNNAQPGGEMKQVVDEQEKIMSASNGVPITKENVQEAREQIRKQGIDDGPFSELDIAKVIDKANSERLDYKTVIMQMYPNYFN